MRAVGDRLFLLFIRKWFEQSNINKLRNGTMRMRKKLKGFNTSNQISHVYQPIWDLDKWSLFGYEALIKESISPKDMNKERLFSLDTKSILNAIECFPFQQQKPTLMFIPVYPSTLLHDQFKSFILQVQNQFLQFKGKVVFELCGSGLEDYVWRNNDFKEKISFIRENNILIAINGIGTNGATLLKIMQIEPDYIKIDSFLANELYTSKEKQHFISIVMKFSRGKTGVIVEGVEKEIDLAQAKLLQVSIVQGKVFGPSLEGKRSIQTKDVERNKSKNIRATYSFWLDGKRE